MSETPSISNLGAPVAVDVAAVEQELRALWKTASEREGEGAVIRACSCNLIVLVQNRQEAESILAVVAHAAEWHPCRSIIAYRESDPDAAQHAPAPHVHAWISAQCVLAAAGGPQICSEVITLAARGKDVSDLLNTLVALLIPDLPVFLYWRSFKETDRELVERMVRFAQLLIVDSHASKDDPQNRERLLDLLINPPESIAVRDLNWARLTAWRDLVAQFFDNPGLRHLVFEISEVEIARDIAAPHSVPTRTLLLAGWLASRLAWRRLSVERRADQWISRWKSDSGEVVVRFTGKLATGDQTTGIVSIALHTRTGSTFKVVREKGSTYINATTLGNESELVHSVPQGSLGESMLLVRELSLAGKDPSFRSALAEALDLEKSFAQVPFDRESKS